MRVIDPRTIEISLPTIPSLLGERACRFSIHYLVRTDLIPPFY